MKRIWWLSLLAISCSPEFVTPEELQAYVLDGDNGLRKTIAVNDYKVEVTYRPTDLWVKQELGNNPASADAIEKLRKKYDSYYYFILSLSRNNKEALHSLDGGMTQYSELVQTMSFRMTDYVTMTTNANDTIPVGDFILNRTYGMSPSTDLLFVFNKEKALKKDWIQFNLNEFGLEVGNLRFRFNQGDLQRAPHIKFQPINNEQSSINN